MTVANVIAAAAVLVTVAGSYWRVRWGRWDRQRRLQRLAKRGLA